LHGGDTTDAFLANSDYRAAQTHGDQTIAKNAKPKINTETGLLPVLVLESMFGDRILKDALAV